MIAACGCFNQSLEVSIQYFSYRTSNRITQTLLANEIYKSPPISICYGVPDIIDWDALSQSDPSFSDVYNGKFESAENYLKLTVKQMFDFSPNQENIFRIGDGCAVRNKFKTRTRLGGSDCNNIFHVHKYYTQSYICYIFRLKNPVELRTGYITNSLFDLFRDFDIKFGEKFSNASYIMPIIFDRKSSAPFLARSTSRYTRLFSDSTHKMRLPNFFNTEPTWITLHLLPPPYETRCVHKSNDELHGCRTNCSIDRLKPFQKVPHYDIITEPYPFKPISYTDLENETFSEIYDKILSECIEECHFNPCESVFTVTLFWSVKTESNLPGVSILTATTLHTDNHAIPLMSFVDYFSLVSGSIGTWFGISFLSIEFVGRKLCSCCAAKNNRPHQTHRERMNYLTTSYTTRTIRRQSQIIQQSTAF